MLIPSSNSNHLPQRCSFTRAISNHKELDLESKEEVPEHPSPNAEPDFAHHNGSEILHCAGGTILQQFRLFTANSWTYLILQRCTVILATDHCSNCQEMVKHRSISEHPNCAMQLSSLVMLGHAIQHPVILGEGQMNACIPHQPSKCNQGMHCSHFSNAPDGWWKDEHASLFDQG